MTTAQQPAARTTGYLAVLRTPGVAAWFLVVLCQRLPIAMAPLALVLLGERAAGSFSVGALLAGVFALAEAVAAGAMGRRFDRRPPTPELRLVLTAQGAALLLVPVVPLVAAGPVAVAGMAVLTAVAGAVGAGAHGGLRALVVRSVPVGARHQALGLEATSTALVWAVGPAVVTVLALAGGPIAAVLATAVLPLVGAVAAGALVAPGPVPGTGPAQPVWRRCWPAMLHEGAVLLVVGAAFTALPPLLAGLGATADLSGLALGGFAAAGIAGGVLHGSRRWRTPYRRQVTALVLVLCAGAAGAAVVGAAVPAVVLLLLGGLASTPALTARGAALQELLPEARWSAGFSVLYAAGGAGFGVAGLVVAPLLPAVGAGAALGACAGLAAVVAVVASVAEGRLVRGGEGVA
jgi:hypothetical protein